MFQVVLAKGIIGTILNYIIIYYRQIPCHLHIAHTHKWLLIINSCILCYFYTLPLSQLYLPLPIVHTIGCSSIALVYLIDYFINGIKVSRNGVGGIILALFGVFIMANNRYFMRFIDSDYKFDTQFPGYNASSLGLAAFIALVLFISRIFNTYGLVKFKDFKEVTVF